MQARGLDVLKVRQVVIITLTQVRHKRHVIFLTLAPTFFFGGGAGSADPSPDPAFPSRCPPAAKTSTANVASCEVSAEAEEGESLTHDLTCGM